MSKTETNTTRKPRHAASAPELPALNNAGNTDAGSANGDADTMNAEAPSARRATKTSIVLDLLRREQGALLADIVAATGWQPHTARAALTGLKKKGHAITSTKVDKVTCYKLA